MSVWWIEARGAAKPPIIHRRASTMKHIQPQVSRNLRLRNVHYDYLLVPGLSQYSEAPAVQVRQAARLGKPFYPLTGGNSWP